jgi:thiosulfate dehydrogenase
MKLKLMLNSLSVVMVVGLAGFVAGCPVGPVPPECQTDADCDDDGLFCNGTEGCDTDLGECVSSGDPCDTDTQECDEEADDCVAGDPQGFKDADATRGGSLYDKWWKVDGVTASEPTDDHALWAQQTTNARSGADTWRCKECHGWDYKGVDGAYGSGSHMTGFAGIFGTTKTPTEVFDLLHNDHAYGDAGVDLGDANIWDLAKFVLEGGQRDTDDIIDANGAFIGDAANGDTLYNNGIGGDLACMICHGADGQTLNFKDPPDEEFIGGLADGNPWEFQHKVWYGHPGTAMPAAADVDATNDDVADVGAHAQTLP